MANPDYANPLHNAAQDGDVEALRRCLTPEALAACPIDTRDIGKRMVLHALCCYVGPWRHDRHESRRGDDRNAEDVEVCLQLLLEAGADLEALDNLGWSPLHALAWSSGDLGTEASLRLASLLLRHGAKMDNHDSVNSTVLHAAASHASSSMVSLLLKAGAAVNAPTEAGHPLSSTPLDMAFLFGRRDNLPILLRAGGVLNCYHVRRPDFPREVLDGSRFEYEYLAKVDAGGGFKKYEQAHLATLQKTFAPKFPVLPPEMVRHILTFCFHAGFY